MTWCDIVTNLGLSLSAWYTCNYGNLPSFRIGRLSLLSSATSRFGGSFDAVGFSAIMVGGFTTSSSGGRGTLWWFRVAGRVSKVGDVQRLRIGSVRMMLGRRLVLPIT